MRRTELSKIGSIRAPVDLLESVVYPAATIACGWRTYIVQTKEGRAVTVLLAGETADAVCLKTAGSRGSPVVPAAIESITSRRRQVPQGWKEQAGDELRDLIAFLRSLK